MIFTDSNNGRDYSAVVNVYLSSSNNDDLFVITEAEVDVLINFLLNCIIVYWKWDKGD